MEPRQLTGRAYIEWELGRACPVCGTPTSWRRINAVYCSRRCASRSGSQCTPRAGFDEQVNTSAGTAACWPWAGPVYRTGYGRFGRSLAHRVAYERANGQAPPAGHRFHVHHTCHVPVCVNPAHLRLVSAKEHKHIHMENPGTRRSASNDAGCAPGVRP